MTNQKQIIQINENTWRIEDGLVRFYLFCGTEKAALIDSGMDSPDARSIAESLTDLPLILINTHTDGDHTSGNSAFEKIYMSPAEEEHYRAENGKGILIPVKEGDVIELGGRPLRIIDIPGHTPGSIAILDVANRILVSGDTVQDDKIFMFGERRDLESFAESLVHLMEYIDLFDEIYPMHGTFPVRPDLIQKLISGVQDIVSGQAEGVPGIMFGTEVTQYIFPYAEILCDKERITNVKNKMFDMSAPDYSREECWLSFPQITKDIDTFYIYSTTYVESSKEKGAPDYAPLNNPEMVLGAQGEYVTNASVFEDSTNVFAPYYRQAGIKYAGEIREKTGNIDAAISGIPYDDISAALDYFFGNCNCGRPFIIAGHSQGSGMVKYVLQHYFKDHPDYYERMVAAYVIGFSVTKDDLESCPHLKFATGESDTGVIISWNTEGPKNVETNAHNVVVMPNAISINPLNWKLDETYAPAGENLGSLVLNEKTGEYEIADIGADAKVVLSRGVVVTNARSTPSEMTDYFGPDSFHEDEYNIFYNNIKENAAKRIAAYKSSLQD